MLGPQEVASLVPSSRKLVPPRVVESVLGLVLLYHTSGPCQSVVLGTVMEQMLQLALEQVLQLALEPVLEPRLEPALVAPHCQTLASSGEAAPSEVS